MAQLRVQKYGGSSVDSLEKIKSIALNISNDYRRGDRFIVVVSAMGHETDNLTKMAHSIAHNPHPREMDMLLSAGERISMALMSLALNDCNVPAISFTGSQAGIMTHGPHGDASIKEVRPIRLEEELKKNKVIVLAGFQGVDPITKEVTTLGRGGSDTTAIAMADCFKVSCCEFKKDTEGLFDSDPHNNPHARHFPHLTWQQIVDMAEQGAPFLHLKAAHMALNKRVCLEFSHAHKSTSLKTVVQS